LFNGQIRDIYEHRDANQYVIGIPFNSTNKFQVHINRMENDPRRFVLTMKGAPEIIFAHCTTITSMIQQVFSSLFFFFFFYFEGDLIC
jgi:magnesium-transporting ATPase (P-type)